MTRRDYELLADAFDKGRSAVPTRDMANTNFRAGYNRAVLELARRLALVNPRFDTQRFLTNSGAR